jgi:hypothetical protein
VGDSLTLGSMGPAFDGAAASYLSNIRAAQADPQQLEHVYQGARRAQATDRFAADLLTCYRESPDNLLYAAWFYRLQGSAHEDRHAGIGGHWKLAVPLSVALGLVLWLTSDPSWLLARGIPYLALLGAPIVGTFIIAFLAFSAQRHYVRSALAVAALAGATAYALLVTPRGGSAGSSSYLTLMVAHLPLLAGSAVGGAVLGWRSSAKERLAFLNKSIETIGTAGVAAIAGGIFVGITYMMFQALSITIPDVLMRLLVAGGAGLIPVLAVAAVYDPAVSPSEQDFGRGFGRILVVLMRALLPLTLTVLVIYLFVIPFNFWQPFVNRDVLIVYNVMLFGIMGLLIGVTPLAADALPERYQRWLRAGIAAVAGLALLVGLYALAAVAYRTAQGSLTMNRLTVIGWNVVNLVILGALLFKQLRPGRQGWVGALQSAFRLGTVLYVVWGAFVVLAYPWVF